VANVATKTGAVRIISKELNRFGNSLQRLTQRRLIHRKHLPEPTEKTRRTSSCFKSTQHSLNLKKHVPHGLAFGVDVARGCQTDLPVIAGSADNGIVFQLRQRRNKRSTAKGVCLRPERIRWKAQARRCGRAKKKLCKEDSPNKPRTRSTCGRNHRSKQTRGIPKGTDVFLQKITGFFIVAPAQDSYMMRVRILWFVPGMATGGCEWPKRFRRRLPRRDTRANLQFREIQPTQAANMLFTASGTRL